jgi:uncharacterized protein involved in response to NO
MILEEPYRVFFPLGMLAAIWGVMMWPLMYAGLLRFYPGEAHTRMMIEGFMGAFVLGFSGTAFPRLTGNRSWFGGEFCALLLLWALTVASHAAGRVAAGDAVFAALLLVLFVGLAGRWIFGHRDTPPPGFALAFAGILGAAIAAGWLARANNPAPGLNPWARLWLFQGFPLLPLMGIGPYLLPRFFGMSSTHSFDDSPTPPAGWWPRTFSAIAAGLLVAASFALEVSGRAAAGHLLRAGVILAWFALETPVLERVKMSTTPGNAVRWALHSLAAGCACAAFWPFARVGALHLFFAAGLGLVTMAVGARVVLGHAGRHDLLGGKIIWLRWVVGLLVLAAATRMSADFLPDIRSSHLIYAAWTWALGGCIWLGALATYFFRHENSAKPKSRCPRRGLGPLRGQSPGRDAFPKRPGE